MYVIFDFFFWPGCIRGVVGEGMPGYRRPFDKGNLYIKFEIEFPPNNFIPCDKISVSTVITCINVYIRSLYVLFSFDLQ